MDVENRLKIQSLHESFLIKCIWKSFANLVYLYFCSSYCKQKKRVNFRIASFEFGVKMGMYEKRKLSRLKKYLYTRYQHLKFKNSRILHLYFQCYFFEARTRAANTKMSSTRMNWRHPGVGRTRVIFLDKLQNCIPPSWGLKLVCRGGFPD